MIVRFDGSPVKYFSEFANFADSYAVAIRVVNSGESWSDARHPKKRLRCHEIPDDSWSGIERSSRARPGASARPPGQPRALERGPSRRQVGHSLAVRPRAVWRLGGQVPLAESRRDAADWRTVLRAVCELNLVGANARLGGSLGALACGRGRPRAWAGAAGPRVPSAAPVSRRTPSGRRPAGGREPGHRPVAGSGRVVRVTAEVARASPQGPTRPRVRAALPGGGQTSGLRQSQVPPWPTPGVSPRGRAGCRTRVARRP